MKKATQEDLNALHEDISQEMTEKLKDQSTKFHKAIDKERIERRTEDVSMSNNLMKRLHERMVELVSSQKQLKQRDTVIFNLSKEIDDMRTERIFLKTQLRRQVQENQELQAELDKVSA